MRQQTCWRNLFKSANGHIQQPARNRGGQVDADARTFHKTLGSCAFRFLFFGIFLTLIFGAISKAWNLQAIYISASIFLLVFTMWALVNRKVFSLKKDE